MLFSMDAWPGLADGSITTTFRAWGRAQAKVGSTHRVGDLRLHVDDVQRVRVGDLVDADARAAGEASVDALRRRLGSPTDEVEVWRIDFHRADEPDPRASLAAAADLDDVALADIDRRLDRLDAASTHGPWTRITLATIAEHPAVVSTVLAEQLGRVRAELKVDIRKLKNLGLTLSLGTGYRLSPRGESYLARRAGSG